MRRLYPGPADTLLPKRCSARALVSVADKDVAPSHAGRLLAPGVTPERIPQPHQAETEQRVTEGDHDLNPDRRRERDYGSAKGQQDAGTPRQHASAGDRDTKRNIADAEHQAGHDQLPQSERRPRTEIGGEEVLPPLQEHSMAVPANAVRNPATPSLPACWSWRAKIPTNTSRMIVSAAKSPILSAQERHPYDRPAFRSAE